MAGYVAASAPPAGPVISVITPVFRGAAMLQACLDNVAAQGCPHVEHIVVDGGSDDGTWEDPAGECGADAVAFLAV